VKNHKKVMKEYNENFDRYKGEMKKIERQRDLTHLAIVSRLKSSQSHGKSRTASRMAERKEMKKQLLRWDLFPHSRFRRPHRLPADTYNPDEEIEDEMKKIR